MHLSAGDMIPADVRILEAKDLFISQSSLTGESEPVEKTPHVSAPAESITDYPDIEVVQIQFNYLDYDDPAG